MATKDITIAAPDTLTVKAVAGSETGAAAAAASATSRTMLPEAVKQQAEAAIKSLNKRLMDALEAHRAQRASGSLEEAQLQFPPLLWNLATVGAIQLSDEFGGLLGNPPHDVNKVIHSGHFAAMIGVSYADPTTMPPSNMYMAGKEYRARFSAINLTTASAPGAGELVDFGAFTASMDAGGGVVLNSLAPNSFSVAPFHFFLWIFQLNTRPGSEAELYEINFQVDISTPFVPGGGFSNWVFDVDTTPGIPIGVPGVGPGWRYNNGARLMVTNFPG